MQKSPEITPLEIREPNPIKTRRNRKPTACQDLRRSLDHCGICGSGNVVAQGVAWCRECGAEVGYVVESSFDTAWNRPKACDCKWMWLRGLNQASQGFESVRKCLDCGAVDGPRCPSCHRPAWGKGMSVYCRGCGFFGERKEG